MTNYIIDAATRHQVFIQRYAGGRAKKAVATLNRLRRQVMARMGQSPTEFQHGRLDAMLRDIDALLLDGFGQIGDGVKAEALDFAESEADFTRRLTYKAYNVDMVLPSDAILSAAVSESIMGTSGLNIEDALRVLSTKKREQVANLIKDGVALGSSPQVINKEVGVLMNTLHRRQVSAFVHTTINHISSVARTEMYKANERLLDGYEWVATLDNRTTLICGSRDGKVYQVGIGPMPPAHWNCRSTTIPATKGRTRGTRPSVVNGKVEMVGAKTTYGGWLKKQPIEFIEEALGRERALLFKSGRLSLEKFVDPTGRVYTLKQLESMNPFVFQEN